MHPKKRPFRFQNLFKSKTIYKDLFVFKKQLNVNLINNKLHTVSEH